ncbi:SRPBCC family protein [Sunxiuqinia sp. sy24]|uniref:SRPBCC family protein n=1 Tax=Sunxiuqinia sp. sy24 TaxID=3461495 RepID=UPI0040457A5E
MISINKHAGIYTLKVEQKLPISLDEAWDFFSNPLNLERITPSNMQFKITSGKPKPMHPGQIITYRVAPFKGFSTNWVTEITHVADKQFFVDEQRFGPYSMWHHEHHFEAKEYGILMTDKVSYKLPLGWLGNLAQQLFVYKQLQSIFNYRYTWLSKQFKN